MRRTFFTILFLTLSFGYCHHFTARAGEEFFSGLLRVDVYFGIPGTSIGDLTGSPKFPDNPDAVEFIKFAEYPPGGDDGTPPSGSCFDNYGARISGFVLPQETANYVFFIASDDNGELYLSTDGNPATKVLIAMEPEWNGVRTWTEPSRRPGCPDNGGTQCDNRSDPIALEAGKLYYLEALFKEGGGGDNLAVTWKKDTDPDPIDGTPSALTGDVIGVIASENDLLSPPLPPAKLNPETGHWYQSITVCGGISWDDAKAQAETLGGYLATITSEAENLFIFDEFPEASELVFFGYWIGGFQPGDTPVPDLDPAAGWQWVTDEVFDFTNWFFDEPNDCECVGSKEDAIHLWAGVGAWNDLPRENLVGGFVVEYNQDPNDDDGDGVPNSDDACPNSDLNSTVVIGGCDSGVPNTLISSGCTIADLIAGCAAGAKNHGDFVSCVAKLTSSLRAAGSITGAQKGGIDSCAARTAIP